MSKVVFIHIPKTSGSALKLFFRDALTDFFIQANSPHQLQSGDPLTGRIKDFDDIQRVMKEHGGLALHVDSNFEEVRSTKDFRSLAPYVFDAQYASYFAKFSIVTMVREPFRRFLSDYAFVQRMQQRDPGFLADLDVFDIEDYMKHLHPNPVLHFLLERKTYIRRQFNRRDLDHVKRVIERLPIHVGIYERHAESIVYFGRVLDLDFSGAEVPAHNVGDVPAHDPALERAFREQNSLDIELYEFACELFDARRKAKGAYGTRTS